MSCSLWFMVGILKLGGVARSGAETGDIGLHPGGFLPKRHEDPVEDATPGLRVGSGSGEKLLEVGDRLTRFGEHLDRAVLAGRAECRLDKHLGDVVAIDAGSSSDPVSLLEIDLGVAGTLIVEPAGTHNRVGMAADAQEALGEALPVPPGLLPVGGRDAHGGHEADVGLRPALECLEERGQYGVVVVLEVVVTTVGQDDAVDAVDDPGQ